MNPSLLASIEKNLTNGITTSDDFLYIQSIWNTLSPSAQASIFELSNTAAQYANNAIAEANTGDINFSGNWKEYTLGLMKKQIKNIEQEDYKNESITPALFAGL